MLLWGLTAAEAAAQEYTIKLHRPEKVGDTYTLSATGSSKTTYTIHGPAGPRKRESAFSVKVAGTVRVLEVSDVGLPTKLSFTVETCLRDDKPLFDKGTVITADNPDGKRSYTVDGKPVSTDATEALALVVQAHRPGQQDLDATFGTDKPQKVGGTWPVHAAAAAAELGKANGLEAKPEDVTGTAKLSAVKEVDGKAALQVDMALNIANTHGGPPGGPQQIESGEYEYRVSGLFPTGPKAKLLSQDLSLKATFHAKVKTPGGKEVPVDVNAEQNAKISFGQTQEQK